MHYLTEVQGCQYFFYHDCISYFVTVIRVETTTTTCHALTTTLQMCNGFMSLFPSGMHMSVCGE